MKTDILEINGVKYNIRIYYEIRKDTIASIRNNNINGVFRYVIGVTGGIEHAGIGIQETHGNRQRA